MSASYVRAKTRTWCNDVATFTGVPFYETVNTEQNPADAVWWSVAFNSEYFEGTFCEPGYIESGFIRIMVNALPGTGDTAAINAIESILPELMKKVDPTSRLVFESHEPINEDSGGSAESSYRIGCLINYTHSLP